MTDMLLRIGEFARLVGLPVKTIRYYGDIGLVPPADIDARTGYRLYKLTQVERVHQVRTLKELGLSLEEVGSILTDRLSDEQFRDLLAVRVGELTERSNTLRQQLERAKAHLNKLNRKLEHTMPDVTIKTTTPITIAFVRDRIDGVEKLPALFARLFTAVDPDAAVGPGGNIYHFFADDGSDIDAEAVLPVAGDYTPADGADVRTLPAIQVASLTHHGAFNRLHEAHTALFEWVAANGYQPDGPSFEWNLVCTEPVTQDNESYVTEIHLQVTAVK